MKGNRFPTIPQIVAAMQKRMKTSTNDNFQSCFKSWQYRGSKCVDTRADCLKGN
jgi:hypothetical protein